MNHLHFVQALDVRRGAGLGSASLGLHGAMLSHNVQSTLLTTRGQSEQVDYDQVRALARTGPDRLYFARGLTQAASEELRQADVVHGHGLYVYPNLVIPHMARSRRLPYVYHPHGMLEPWALRRSRGKKAVARLLFEERNMENASLWRALTSREADQIRHQGIGAPIVVIPNGVDLSLFPKRPSISREMLRYRRLLFLGRVHPIKGLKLLLIAWSMLGDYKKNWKLVIAGPDESGHLAELVSIVERHDLAESVEFSGPVNADDRRALFESADAFALTSFSEGFPIAVVEAMASGLPVLVTRQANIDAIGSRGAGFVCEANPDSVLVALLQLLSLDDEGRHQMGVNGRAWVEAEFTWPVVTGALLNACEAHFT